ncbi:30S ribosomal protein S2 [soil metagenome]
MPVVTMRQLLEAGVHFGHQTKRWNPKMRRFIFTQRNGIYILDLQQTMSGIEKSYEFVRDLVAGGGTVLFVATKRQLQGPVAEQAQRAGMPFVNFRWLGGMLTNFRTIHERIKRMRELEELEESGGLDGFIKKEALKLRREREKLSRSLLGLRDMDELPNAVFILDTKKEEIAVREARKLGIPIVAVLDTNCDPDEVDFGIPGNDDAIRAGAILTRVIADAVIEGKSMRPAGAQTGDESQVPEQPAEVLPGAAAQPKAEWELLLEAEEQATEETPAEEPGDAAQEETGAQGQGGQEAQGAPEPAPSGEEETSAGHASGGPGDELPAGADGAGEVQRAT